MVLPGLRRNVGTITGITLRRCCAMPSTDIAYAGYEDSAAREKVRPVVGG